MSAQRVVMCLLSLALSSVAAQAQNGAQFVGFSPPPGTMNPGQGYTVSVTMRNTGQDPWIPGGHRLGAVNPYDNGHWGMSRVDLPGYVWPNQVHTFTFNVTAPQGPGTYAWDWRMVHEHVEWFGEYTPTIWVVVGTPPPPGSSGSVESGAALNAPIGPLELGTPSRLNWFVHCRAFGSAPVANGGYSFLRIRLYVDGLQLKDSTFTVAPGANYDRIVRSEISAAEQPRTLNCRTDLDVPGSNDVVYHAPPRQIPGNGPRYSEVLIKTFIPNEWVLGPAQWAYPPEIASLAVIGGDNRGFDYYDQHFRTRVWGWINNPAFDATVLRASTPPVPGLSETFDPWTSVSPQTMEGHLTAEAKADWQWGAPLKLTWANADMSRVGCTEFSFLGLVGNRAGVRFRCHHEANFPLFTLSPDIDWRYNVDLWFGDSNEFVTIFDSCIDYFPSHEMYIHTAGVVISPASLGLLGGVGPICQKGVSLVNYGLFQ